MKQRSTRTVYKVVRKYGSMLVSLYFNASEIPGVLYVPNEWAHVPEEMRKYKYGLCVFDTLADVYQFTYRKNTDRTPRDLQVWECVALGVRKPRVKRLSIGDVVPVALGQVPISRAMQDEWPTGTLHADAVRLIRPVPWSAVKDACKEVR